MAKISWTVESEQWLKKIHAYIFQDNPNAAIHIAEAIYNRAQVLRNFQKWVINTSEIQNVISEFYFMVITESHIL